MNSIYSKCHFLLFSTCGLLGEVDILVIPIQNKDVIFQLTPNGLHAFEDILGCSSHNQISAAGVWTLTKYTSTSLFSIQHS